MRFGIGWIWNWPRRLEEFVPCKICGDEVTVRSHILTKAIARDLRRGHSHTIVGSSRYDGVKKLPGGAFSDKLLCQKHEAATSKFDTYGVAFLRRAKDAFDAYGPESFWVENHDPQLLSQFVASVIWREVHSFSDESLGPYDSLLRNHIFSEGCLDWPILVWRDNFTLDDKRAIEFNTHPYRTKFLSKNAWMFTALGFSFVAISDKRGVRGIPDEMIANQSNPLRVIVGHQMDYRDIPTLQPILKRMRQKPKS